MKNLTEKQKKTLQELRRYYCKEFAEDPIDGSNFDNAVLDVLRNHFVQEWMSLMNSKNTELKANGRTYEKDGGGFYPID